MCQFDRENREVIALVNENHRRSRICPTVGIVVPIAEARRMAVRNTRSVQPGSNFVDTLFAIFSVFIVVMAGVLILA